MIRPINKVVHFAREKKHNIFCTVGTCSNQWLLRSNYAGKRYPRLVPKSSLSSYRLAIHIHIIFFVIEKYEYLEILWRGSGNEWMERWRLLFPLPTIQIKGKTMSVCRIYQTDNIFWLSSLSREKFYFKFETAVEFHFQAGTHCIHKRLRNDSNKRIVLTPLGKKDSQ